MSNTFTIERVTREFNSRDQSALNPAQFQAFINQERAKFMDELVNRKQLFVDQQDLGPMGLSCTFFALNGYPTAVRQLVVFEAREKNVYVCFDSELLVPVAEEKEEGANV